MTKPGVTWDPIWFFLVSKTASLRCFLSVPPKPLVFPLMNSRCAGFASHVPRVYMGAQSQSNCRGSFVVEQQQQQYLTSSVMMSLVAGSCEILEKMRTSLKPSWALHIPRASWSSVVSFHLLQSPAYVSATTDCLLWVHVGVKNCWTGKNSVSVFLFVFWQKTSSMSQLPVEDLKDPLPPQWRCYMSPQGRRYYVNTTNNGKSIHCDSLGHMLLLFRDSVLCTTGTSMKDISLAFFLFFTM